MPLSELTLVKAHQTKLLWRLVLIATVFTVFSLMIYVSASLRNHDIPLLSYAIFSLCFVGVAGLSLYEMYHVRELSQKSDKLLLASEVEERLLDQWLTELAAASHGLYWVARANESVTMSLYGPWDEQVEIEEKAPDIDTVFASVVDHGETRQAMANALLNRQPISRIIKRVVNDEVRTLQSTARPIYGQDGRYIGLLGVSVDINTALSTEATVEKAKADQQAHREHLRRLVRKVARPVKGMEAAIQRIRSSLPADEKRAVEAHLDVIDGDLSYLARLTSTAEEFRELRSSGAKLARHGVDPCAAVRGALPAVLAECGADASAVRFDAPQVCWNQVRTNQSALTRIIHEVVKNALNFAKPREGGPSAVIAVSGQKTCLITVTTFGEPLSRFELAHSTDPFYRSEEASKTQGIGLGLPIAMALADASGMAIGLSNGTGDGEGLVVSIEIPWVSDWDEPND